MHFWKPLDIDLMNEASSLLLTFSDFTSFSKVHTDVKTNNCHIYKALWKKEGDELQFVITANRFLRNMVRAVVGTLLQVGMGKMSIDQFIQIIEQKNRADAGTSVDSQGLHLINIDYPESFFLSGSEK
jgi:tRNA pseudouridine38-40 synthase